MISIEGDNMSRGTTLPFSFLQLFSQFWSTFKREETRKSFSFLLYGGGQSRKLYSYTVELQWLEQLWNHKNIFETGEVRANEC